MATSQKHAHAGERPHGVARTILALDVAGAHATGAAAALLADFEDALLAYDHLSASALDATGTAEPPRFHHASLTALLENDQLDASLAPCDTIVAALEVSDDTPGAALGSALDALARANALAPGQRVYAIAVADAPAPSAAHPGLEAVAACCRERDLAWMGGLAAGRAKAVAARSVKPRMGRARRACSEALDRLIGAARAGVTVSASAELFGARDAASAGDVIDVPDPAPAILYRLLYR